MGKRRAINPAFLFVGDLVRTAARKGSIRTGYRPICMFREDLMTRAAHPVGFCTLLPGFVFSFVPAQRSTAGDLYDVIYNGTCHGGSFFQGLPSRLYRVVDVRSKN